MRCKVRGCTPRTAAASWLSSKSSTSLPAMTLTGTARLTGFLSVISGLLTSPSRIRDRLDCCPITIREDLLFRDGIHRAHCLTRLGCQPLAKRFLIHQKTDSGASPFDPMTGASSEFSHEVPGHESNRNPSSQRRCSHSRRTQLLACSISV